MFLLGSSCQKTARRSQAQLGGWPMSGRPRFSDSDAHSARSHEEPESRTRADYSLSRTNPPPQAALRRCKSPTQVTRRFYAQDAVSVDRGDFAEFSQFFAQFDADAFGRMFQVRANFGGAASLQPPVVPRAVADGLDSRTSSKFFQRSHAFACGAVRSVDTLPPFRSSSRSSSPLENTQDIVFVKW